MNTQNTNASNFLVENRNRLLFFFVLFLLSSIGMFGQTSSSQNASFDKECVVFQESNSVLANDSQIDFVNWFMGSKQSQMIDDNSETTSNSNGSTKKQIISSGIIPNRVLYKTFVKKVVSSDNAIV